MKTCQKYDRVLEYEFNVLRFYANSARIYLHPLIAACI